MRLISVGTFFSVCFYVDIEMILASLDKKYRSILKHACTKKNTQKYSLSRL